VPFALLAGSRDVAYVPSGTTLGVLADAGGPRGTKVLAVGVGVYGSKGESREAGARDPGGGLAPLPAAPEEARAVGDVVLLDGEATEPGLRAALAERPRWRAVHFACHGFVDTERPSFSSLALTPAAPEDGLLTCLEVFRMKVPADLVVLSACETARGKVYRAEGIVGLTRAFMMAGAPRVLCSLWKVDDEATKSLMVKFYELWNPPSGADLTALPAATALRKAQEFVRSREKWRHPCYWAAWVLWGLPD
jgi:CHAT domain-containing protein